MISECWPPWVLSFKELTPKGRQSDLSAHQVVAFGFVKKERQAYSFLVVPTVVGSEIYPDFPLKMVEKEHFCSAVLPREQNKTTEDQEKSARPTTRGNRYAPNTTREGCKPDTMKPALGGKNRPRANRGPNPK